MVRLTRGDVATIRSYIANGPLADLVEVRPAQVTSAQLQADQATAIRTVRAVRVPADFEIDVKQNRVTVYVTDRTRLDTALQAANLQLPDSVTVVTVAELSKPTADIYGGLALSTCTSGFSVYGVGGTRYITTAGHCGNAQSYNGTNLPYVNENLGGSNDFQWHSIPAGNTAKNLVWDGTNNRFIYSTKAWGNQAINELVCKYGKTTKYGCGYITAKNIAPGYVPNATATFIRVHNNSGVDLANGGDSGGPWFYNNTAYGIMSGEIGADAVYMAINYISNSSLTVLTN